METVGNGFLARHLRRLAARHTDTVALAAGVSWTGGTSEGDFAREAKLVREVASRCADTGRRLLFFSTASSGMYPAERGPGREDTPVVPGNPYAAHKMLLEQVVRSSGADHLVLRLGHLVGAGQPPHQLIPTLVRQLREGTVRVYRRATRDLIDVADVVVIIDRLLARDLRGEMVNVASGAAVPVERIIDHLADRLGVSVQREYLDAGDRHDVSIAKLRSLVPEVSTMDFGPDYHRRVLDAYLSSR